MSVDKETISVYDAKVDDYIKTFSHKGADPALTRFMDALPLKGKVLDFGCGPGRHAHLLAAHGFDVMATDASSAMVENARKLGGFQVKQALFDDLKDENVFDGIWANFSLLHAPCAAFPAHIKAIATALKPKGVFHLGMKLGQGEKRDRLGRQYSYFTIEEFREILNAEGFTILGETFGVDKGLAGTADPWVEILAQK